MKAKEFVNFTDEELQEKLKEAKTELFNLRFQLATGQLENNMKIREIRKDIARIQTTCRERELKEQKGA